MTTNSILLVGSYVVPLVAVAVFAVLYRMKYKNYLIEKNTYSDCQFLEDAWKSYIFSRLALEKCRTSSSFWWYFFGEKYINLVNYCSDRCIYELDQLDRFEESSDNRPCFHRKTFMRHWEEIRSMLFDKGGYPDFSYLTCYMFKKEFGQDPFGWMTVMIESRLFELYKKHALQLLRTKGFCEFSNFLALNYVESKRYPHNAAFSIIASGKFHEKIMWDNSQEIAERLQHEVKIILGRNKMPKDTAQIEKLELLTETFVLKGGLAGGGYSGIYYAGLTESRKAVFDLLKEEKVLN